MKRYANQREAGEKEGNEKLFWYNQFQVATYRQKCCYASPTGEFDHFVEWKDPYPYTLSDIETEGGEAVNSQQVLVQGMLSRETLLDILHSYIVFATDDKGRVIKLAPRYQQYRTARKILARLKSGDTPQEKSGIVWHTQGSGKSLTMMFTARAVCHDPALSKYKIVFITDRTDLEKQLEGAIQPVGYDVNKAESIAQLKTHLRSRTPDLVMGMVHKFQEGELQQRFPELNDSPDILVMIDEAHRTQYKLLGANLQVALPNAVRIAFTGTPIEKTEVTFGEYIDKYSMRQSLEDGVTVEIVYEGRTHKGEVEQELGRMSNSEPWASQAAYLMQLPGVGVVITMTVLAAIGDIARFESPKKLVGYAGLGAGVHDSGKEHRDKKTTKCGRKELRCLPWRARPGGDDRGGVAGGLA